MNNLVAYTLYFLIIILMSIIIYGMIIYERYPILKHTEPNIIMDTYIHNKNNDQANINNSQANINKNNSSGTTLGDLGYECVNWMNGNLALKIENGNVQCASIDGKNCIANCNEVYDLSILYGDPLVCGQKHYQLYDFTGYDDKSHWCSIYRDMKDELPMEKDVLPNYSHSNIAHGDTITIKGGRNNKYCADDSRCMQCNREGVDFWEKFIIERKKGPGLIENGDIVYIKGLRRNLYCSYDEDQKIRCNSSVPGLWEKFIIENVDETQYIDSNNEILLKSLKTQAYCSDVYGYRTNNKIISCEVDKDKIGNWEKFRINKI